MAVASSTTNARMDQAVITSAPGNSAGDHSSRWSGASIFVWSVHVALVATALVFVIRFGPDIPLWDDYAVVAQLCGDQPVTLGWLWSQHSEHRIPLARVILLCSFWLSGADPRPVLLMMVALLALLAAVLVWSAKRARGEVRCADAFLPIVLLNLGQHVNFLWAIQITYVLPVFLLGMVLAAVVRSQSIPNVRSMAAAAACMVLMPLCNAGGLAFIPALTVWFWATAAGVIRTRDKGGWRKAMMVAVLPAPALLLAWFYFQGYAAPRHHAAPGGIWAALRTTTQFVGMSLGTPGASLWPWSGVLVVVLLAGSLRVLVRAWLRQPAERARIEGLACVLGAVGSLALGTGWGRSGEDVLAGLQARYTTLAIPALLVVYFAFAEYGLPVTRQWAPLAMLAVVLVLLVPNTVVAWRAGYRSGAQAASFDHDLAAGVPLHRLVRRHTPFVHPSQEALRESLIQLGRAGIGKFRTLRGDPPFEEREVPLVPADIRLARWNGGNVEVTGPDPWIRFDLPAAVHVGGVRIRYDHESPDGAPARFRLAWRHPGQYEFPAEQQYGNWNLATGSGRTTTIWIDDVVSQIRIQPDNRPCKFTTAELTLLIAPQPETGRP